MDKDGHSGRACTGAAAARRTQTLPPHNLISGILSVNKRGRISAIMPGIKQAFTRIASDVIRFGLLRLEERQCARLAKGAVDNPESTEAESSAVDLRPGLTECQAEKKRQAETGETSAKFLMSTDKSFN